MGILQKVNTSKSRGACAGHPAETGTSFFILTERKAEE
jgi:hypothetical protein